jgi:hypothetical protein
MNDVVVKEKASLDELMLAMDVVDTMRHKELVLARELQGEDRDAKLLEQLREIYTSQGIEVTDEILQRGVDALREERFAYPQPEPSFSRTLAHAYVTRGRWGKLAGAGVAALAVLGVAMQLLVWGPAERQATEVPAQLTAAFAMLDTNTDDAAALEPARAHLATGQAAVEQGDFDAAREATAEIAALNERVQAQYELRVVSRPGETSGFWRESEEARGARNYYLVVEAIAPNGDALRLPITSEEDQRTRSVRAWGLRVDEATFERAVADKQDDGIIQNAVVGRKRRGVLEREYTVPTTGAAVTDW